MKKFCLIIIGILLLPAFLMAQTSTCTLMGDVNGSGATDVMDALVIARVSAGLTPSSYNSACADVNCSGVVDISDALLVAKLSAGLIASFPCSATPTPTPVGALAIACGSTAAVGDYQLDQYFTNGSTYTNTATIDVSQITSNPPPAALFNSERYGEMSYTLPGFTAGGTYTVLLYFAETYLTAVGGRVFNVSINGTTVLPSFDIYASAGAQNAGIVKWFTTTANTSGQIVIEFTSVTENPKINGIRVQAGSLPTPSPTPTPTPTPTSTGNGSAGCGKELSDLKSGTYKITSAGLEREYIINIPSNYDKNKPYRLIFAMHCYGSSAQGVVNEKFYSLQTYASNANVPVIFVAPNGTGSGTPLWNQGEKDHTFFGDMLKLFKEKLCVDTKRVFTCGFSYGAMFSYSLSLDYYNDLRAVACYAPANWNIWLPTNNHKPVAYFQTTGTSDGSCSWIYDDANKLGGKYCLLQHIQDNGCTVPSNIPLATSGKHVTTEFSGCNPDYPVVFGSFQGGHSGTNNDSGSNVNWIAKESWDFFMRF